MTKYRDILRNMLIGEEIKIFDRTQRGSWQGAAAALYCHGYNFLIRSRKEFDYFTITRTE